MEIRWSYDHIISTMGFPILVRRHLYIESGPRFFGCTQCMTTAKQQTYLTIECHRNIESGGLAVTLWRLSNNSTNMYQKLGEDAWRSVVYNPLHLFRFHGKIKSNEFRYIFQILGCFQNTWWAPQMSFREVVNLRPMVVNLQWIGWPDNGLKLSGN